LTGFKSYSEFREELSPLEQRLLVKSIEAWHEQQSSGGGGGAAGGGAGLPPGL
jgi:uncharacterized membrane protein